jgi:uncharacterized membrane protein YjgN (DUF898 family)
MADIGGAHAGGLLAPPWLDTAPWIPPAATATRSHEAVSPRRHPLSFTGSGSEYFRIWIVNLLALVLSAGLYYPWARVRRLRYFHHNTRLDGHAFDFRGKPARMLRGFLLVWLLFGAYNLASRTSGAAALVGLGAIAALWPALWHASLRFRLGHTSWRGLPFAFEGGAAGAYRAFGAFAALGLPALLLLVFVQARPGDAGFVLPLLLVLALAIGPLGWYEVKRYQHRHCVVADRRSDWQAGRREVYVLFARAAALGLAGALAGGVLIAGAVALVPAGEGPGGGVLVALIATAGFWLPLSLPHAYLEARTQNLVWNRTVAPGLRFDSALGAAPLGRLRVKNLLLLVATLGLYWPWAAVATARLRLAAVAVLSDEPLERLVATLHAAAQDASGDAAAGLAGFDFGP